MEEGQARFILGSAKEGRKVFCDLDDPFLKELSEFEITARAKKQISLEEFLDFQVKQILDWSDEDSLTLRPLLSELSLLLEKFPFVAKNLPKEIRVFVTTGNEEGALESFPVAYCRGSCNIFVSKANLKDEPIKIKKVLYEASKMNGHT